jgi:hypothetical protein
MAATFEPLEFLTEGGFQTEQQNVVARALRRTPAPAGMIVKFLPGHLGNSLLFSAWPRRQVATLGFCSIFCAKTISLTQDVVC